MFTHATSDSSIKASITHDDEQQTILCPVCDLALTPQPIEKNTSAHCPQCHTRLYRGKTSQLHHQLLLAITGLLFFLPTLYFPFVTISLLNIKFSANLVTGSLSLMNEGFIVLGFLVLICSVIIPLIMFTSIIAIHLALTYRLFPLFKWALSIYQALTHWIMLDVFLLSIAVAFFKLQEYAIIMPQVGLLGLALTQIIVITLLSNIKVQDYWEKWKKSDMFSFSTIDIHCPHCHLSQEKTEHCVRCHRSISKERPYVIQKTWALLISACICLYPANFLLISIIFTNGVRYEDTIFSGVVSLVNNNMMPIALIIFVASIIVPLAKIMGLAYILLEIKYRRCHNAIFNTKLFLLIQWIGKWSILDLFVISITIALVDRDQLLDFYPGPAAMAFGAAVILTMLATETMDIREIWRHSANTHSTTNTKDDIHHDH